MSIPMMAITTSSSTSVNPLLPRRLACRQSRYPPACGGGGRWAMKAEEWLVE